MRKSTPEETRWKKAVLTRDKCCVVCTETARLEAHHLEDYSHNPTLRFVVDNGVTMCRRCHELYHCSYNFSFRCKTSKKDFDNFIEMINKVKDIFNK